MRTPTSPNGATRNGDHVNGTAPRPQWQFRDQRVPARLCHLLRDDKITSTDLLLLFVIDSLVRPQGAEDGLGAFPTNKYLGEAVNVHPVYAGNRINYLNELGLVLIVYVGQQRYLEAEWSRTAEEREALAGEYGKAHRKAYRKLLKHLADKDDDSEATPEPASLKEDIGGVQGKPLPPLKGNLEPLHIRVLNTKPGGGAAASRPSTRGVEQPLPLNGKPTHTGNGAAKPPKPLSPECMEVAKAAHKASCDAHKAKVQGSPLVWAKNLAAICKRITEGGESRVLAAFRWYCKAVKQDGYRGPDITCSKAVNERSFLWLEREMKGKRKRRLEDIWAGEPEDEVLEQP